MPENDLLPTKSDPAAPLLADLRQLIHSARERVALYVNAELTLLYWDVGNRIHRDILGQECADYGKEIVETIANNLATEFGNGFGRRNLFNRVRFAEVFADRRIVQTVSAQLSWSHFVEILTLDEPLKREFYTEMARLHRWSVRTLRDKIRSMLFERTALSKKPSELIEQEIALLRDEDILAPDMILRDPYLLPLYLQASLQWVWFKKGETPVVKVAANRDNVHFYGALNLQTGEETVLRSKLMNA